MTNLRTLKIVVLIGTSGLFLIVVASALLLLLCSPPERRLDVFQAAVASTLVPVLNTLLAGAIAYVWANRALWIVETLRGVPHKGELD